MQKPCNTKNKTILLLIILVTSLFVCTNLTSTDAASGRVIDLFTTKALYQPQELVTFHALVTYNEAPVVGKDVAFQVDGPRNSFFNISVWGASRSNASGLAEFSFRLPWPDENPEPIVVGTWSAVATVDIAEQVVNDTLTFQVDWMIIITRIETLNTELSPQTAFLRQKIIIFNLTVENRAATEKTATIAVDVLDASNYPIMHIELEDQILQPGENNAKASAQIPTTATIGLATAWAAPYTAPPKSSGVLYSPAISTTFLIITRDIAVTSVTPSKMIIESGETIEIAVTVKNKGNETESFYVTVYYDHNIISKKHVSALPPSTERQIIFEWNTISVPPDSYIISAVAGPVEGEIEVEDNIFIDGIVTILPVFPPPIRDVAVTMVKAWPTAVEPGETVQIEVDVKNLGASTESFNVVVYYNDIPITAQYVSNLASKAEKKLVFLWGTSGMMEGDYIIKAYIPPLPDETNIDNNLYIDGIVTIRTLVPTEIHDVAITNVYAAPLTVYVGSIIEITVEAANLGDYTETFHVTVYYNHSEIATREILSLNPTQTTTFTVVWNTSGMAEGTYLIWAFAEIVPGEVNVENNVFIDGKVTLISELEPSIRDIAVIGLSANPAIVMVGENITIAAIVANFGDLPESFNLTLLYDGYIIKVIPIFSLPAHSQRTVTFEWNTTSVLPGTYKLRANVTILESETNIENNRFEDAYITIMAISPIYAWLAFLIPLAAIASLALLLLILLFLSRRRRRRKPRKRQPYTVLVRTHI